MFSNLLLSSLSLWLCFASSTQVDNAAPYGYCLQSCEDRIQRKIDGYYWRDYTGDIPIDAYPGRSSKRNQRTYIGKVFDPANKGVFIVTIFPNRTTVDLSVDVPSTLSNNIQILCTQQPEKLVWQRGTPKQLDDVTGRFIADGFQQTDGGVRLRFSIGRKNGSRTTYFGGVNNLTTGLSYTIGTQNLSTMNFDALAYYIDPTEEPPTSIPPVLDGTSYKCSTSCLKLIEEMSGHYWRDYNLTLPNDAIIAGRDENNVNLLVAQAYLFEQTWYPPSYIQIQKRIFQAPGEGSLLSTIFEERRYYKILCSKLVLEWIQTNATGLNSLLPNLIVGGGDANGNLLYVGRKQDRYGVWPGRVYATCNQHITYLNVFNGVTNSSFEVLSYPGSNNPSIY